VSATKSSQIVRATPSRSVAVAGATGSSPSTRSVFASTSRGSSGRIQSRESTDSLAIADAMKLRKCPKREVMPYHRMA
jgi:alcohol dehydrogenase YqhD (iron-dependent ADH family)